MTDESLEARVRSLEKELDDVEHQLAIIRNETKARELNQLYWGVRLLGAIVIGMGAWIWSQVGHLISLNVGR